MENRRCSVRRGPFPLVRLDRTRPCSPTRSTSSAWCALRSFRGPWSRTGTGRSGTRYRRTARPLPRPRSSPAPLSSRSRLVRGPVPAGPPFPSPLARAHEPRLATAGPSLSQRQAVVTGGPSAPVGGGDWWPRRPGRRRRLVAPLPRLGAATGGPAAPVARDRLVAPPPRSLGGSAPVVGSVDVLCVHRASRATCTDQAPNMELTWHTLAHVCILTAPRSPNRAFPQGKIKESDPGPEGSLTSFTTLVSVPGAHVCLPLCTPRIHDDNPCRHNNLKRSCPRHDFPVLRSRITPSSRYVRTTKYKCSPIGN